jgi:hypothetical protein
MLGYTYLKFVIDNIKDFDEVDQAVSEYRAAGFGGQVYVMPVGGTDKAYFSNTRHIADEALAGIHYDNEKDKLVVGKADFSTFSGLLKKYGAEQCVELKELIKLIYSQEREAEAEAEG